MADDSQGNRSEEAKRAAFATRHEAQARARAAAEAARPAPSPAKSSAPNRPLIRRAVHGSRRIAGQMYRGVTRRLPEPVKKHPLAEPFKNVVRAYRRGRRTQPAVAAPRPVAFTGAPHSPEIAAPARAAACALYQRAPAPTEARARSISALVLNRDGAHHLDKLFASIAEHEADTDLEIVIVDHGSKDGSREVITRWSERLDVQAILLDENDSFSASNNRAARAARGEQLLLLNNDIIFERPVLAAMSAALEDPEIGIVAPTLRYPTWHAQHPGGLQHAGIKFHPDARGAFLRPYNLSARHGLEQTGVGLEVVPSVTAACALMRKADYEALGGLFEGFVYGYEDVDLCLRVQRELGLQAVIDHDLVAVHDESATQNKDPGPALRKRREENRARLLERHGYALRRSRAEQGIEGARFLEDVPLRVGLAVTEVGEAAKAGDYFTGLELAKAIEAELGWQVELLPSTRDWYDLEGIDVLVSLLDRYDLRRIHNARPNLLTVAWIRNWFDRWPKRDWFEGYDIVLSSSEVGAKYLMEAHDRYAEVLRIATSPERFDRGVMQEDLRADVAFTGSRWGVPRAIEDNLDLSAVPGEVAIWGQGWDESALEPAAKGFLEYSRMPDVYASCQIVLDDAIEQTRPWGSVNSRVFDALGAGTLIVTNGTIGAEETFGDLLPTYTDRASLTAQLRTLLEDPAQRQRRADALKAEVRSKHTYGNRAYELQDILRRFRKDKLRIAIKVPATNHAVKEAWGDYHFALALRRCFWREGHSVRIDVLCDWDDPRSADDDVVFVLRGLSRYEPNPAHINLMWNISHPDKVSDEEYEAYDHVFVAAAGLARQMDARLEVPVSALLQCTDPTLFFPDEDETVPSAEVLFLGNSRRQHRPAVLDAIEAGLPLTVYGGQWAGIIDEAYVADEHVPNHLVRKHYSRAKVVLNDHWPSMRDSGLVSNRLFDAAACGATIVSDPARGIQEVFGDAVRTYSTVQELRAIVQDVLRNPEAAKARGRALAEQVRAEHSFERRAEVVLQTATELVAQRRAERLSGP